MIADEGEAGFREKGIRERSFVEDSPARSFVEDSSG
jgi:hypothetical protein